MCLKQYCIRKKKNNKKNNMKWNMKSYGAYHILLASILHLKSL